MMKLIDQIKQDLGSPVIRFDTFAPQTEVDLDNASFQLADGRSYLIEDGQLGYRAWKTPRFVSNEEFMARKKELESGMQAIYNKYVAITGKEPTEYFE